VFSAWKELCPPGEPMRNKREYLARLSGRLGVLNLLERLAAARPGLIVFTYHRIAEPGADPFYDPVISATPESFRAQVDWLGRRMRVLTLAEAMERIASGPPWREPAALITFDDGYRDNFEVAAPILRDLGIPATFFLPTAFLESPRLPWWDEVAYILKRTTVRRLELPRAPDDEGPAVPPPLRLGLDILPRPSAIRSVIAAFLDETIRDGPWFLGMLADRAEVARDDGAMARELFAGWEQVRRLTGPGTGLSVGSHGHSHRKLAALGEDDQRRELADSRRILRDRLGPDVPVPAHPHRGPAPCPDRPGPWGAEGGSRPASVGVGGITRPASTAPSPARRPNVGSGASPVLLRARAALHAAIGRSFL